MRIKAKLEEVSWWAVKWFVAAAIVTGFVVYGVHTARLLDRHNQLIDALLNQIRQGQ